MKRRTTATGERRAGMCRRWSWLVLLLAVTNTASGQQVYWKRDHIYNGPGGKEIATVTPAPADQTAPSAPTELSYSSLTATSVTLSWSASTDSGGSGLAGYKIYRQLGSNGAVPVGSGGPGPWSIAAVSFTDPGLTANTAYAYTVTAIDGNGNASAPASAVNVTTPLELLLKDDFNLPDSASLWSPRARWPL